MKSINFLNIRLNQIQIFLKTAECKNFSTAADALHITQPMVSKTIQALENELGLILFIRDNKRVKLTPAGKELYENWKNILQYFESSIADANAIQEGKKDRIVIGIPCLTGDSRILKKLRPFRDSQTRLTLSFETHTVSELWRLLKDDQLDAIISSEHLLDESRKKLYQWKRLEENYMAVFIPRSSPLYDREQIAFGDLRSENFISISAESDQQYEKFLLGMAATAGFLPRISCYVPNELSFRVNLMMGNGIVVADSHADLENEVIKKFVLKDRRNDTVLVWKNSAGSDRLRKLIDAF
ncbi:MAG: LysR family transcriptional regulator [Lachnospiraceae bacterium]|nr:LysR family transcriptional regulator [Lachnospiraceae bacterium]